jgi:hypothetical protein
MVLKQDTAVDEDVSGPPDCAPGVRSGVVAIPIEQPPNELRSRYD